MATHEDFVEHLRNQFGAGLTSRKMFGEYALYLDGKVVALAFDNQLYVKPTGAGRAPARRVPARGARPGGRR